MRSETRLTDWNLMPAPPSDLKIYDELTTTLEPFATFHA